MIPVRVLPKNVALACERFFTTTDFYNGEITAAISRVNTFAALTGMDANKDKFINNGSCFWLYEMQYEMKSLSPYIIFDWPSFALDI